MSGPPQSVSPTLPGPTAPAATAPPVVSIVVATYNRSNVLRYTVQSVLRNSFQAWELIVVGDACTDDTAAVVASFNDPRIRFVNLPQNTGEQSGPNNAGARLATGRYLAYLNHDDFWLADHLAVAVQELEQRGADLVFTLGVRVEPNGSMTVTGASHSGRYEPYLGVPAPVWLFRRGLVEEIGPWRYFREIHAVPSQDWLYRVWRAGKTMVLIPRVTTFIIPSGHRRNSYASRAEAEHAAWFARMTTEPDFRATLQSEALRYYVCERNRPAVAGYVRLAMVNALARLAVWLGRSPMALHGWRKYGRRGGNLDKLRRIRGLPRIE